jgi:hypothetical protein
MNLTIGQPADKKNFSQEKKETKSISKFPKTVPVGMGLVRNSVFDG